ncbi:transposase, partial [Falsiporphyromonas endometrii]
YFTYLDYAPEVRPFIYSTNWVERFNRQIKKAVSYKAALPSVESALYLIGLVALNATYLHRKIGNLSVGLIEIGESSSGAASPRADANPPGVFHVRLTDEKNN